VEAGDNIGAMDELLERQLRDLSMSERAAPSAPEWQRFLAAVSAAYERAGRADSDAWSESAEERQRSAALLAENLALANAVLETVAEAIMVVGTGGRLLATNRRFRELCNLPPELANATHADAILEHLKTIVKDPESLRAMVRTSVEKPGVVYTNDIELKDGRTFERYVAPVLMPSGALYGRVICYLDATIRCQLEALPARIQASILPNSYQVPGLEIAGTMVPAERVGGDYYDVIPTADGCWLGIGDVSGHGLNAGLIMMMTQCAVAAIVRREPNISPAAAIKAVNEVLFENIRQRLCQDDYVTLTLLRIDATGRLCFAGAHQDLLLLRAGTGEVEQVVTQGIWVGLQSDLGDAIMDSTIQINVGDVLVLYSDGVTEARAPTTREQFGTRRLAEILAKGAAKPAADISSDILRAVAAWEAKVDDDRSVVVVRRT
jgi:serine phosphatase RsbU (regulator of sigma subunit)